MKVRAGLKYVITKWFRERPWGWCRKKPRPPEATGAFPLLS